MSDREHNRPSALVFGARNLGRAIIERLIEADLALAGVARSQETLQPVPFPAEQGLRAATHELLLTPLAETWVP